MVKLAEVMVQLSTLKSEKSPDQSPFCTVQDGVGVNVDVGVNVTVGVADGANVGVMVGVDVKVGVGVIVGPNTCPGPQAEIAKPIDNKTANGTRIDWILCFVFISSPVLSWAHPAAIQSELHNFINRPQDK
jgi:hypothetical protein